MHNNIVFTAVSKPRLGSCLAAAGAPHTGIIIKECTGSTNTDLINEIRAGSPVRLIAARMQDNGRGRLGRSFDSVPGGIYFSFAVPMPDGDIPRGLMTPAAGIACAVTLRSAYNIDVRLKWVNDLIYEKKKLGGILCEVAEHGGKVYCVVGIGINAINERFPDTATSLADIIATMSAPPSDTSKHTIDANEIIAETVSAFFRLLPCLTGECEGGVNRIKSEYESLLCMLNVPLRVHTFGRGDGDYNAVATGITPDGALIITRYENGGNITETITSGEVSVRTTE